MITGFSPLVVGVYKLALQHSSTTNSKSSKKSAQNSNERLEYLGDAILGAVVADYLFKKFPYKDEGFLTEMRSKIVSRQSLNDLARKLGLSGLVVYDSKKVGKVLPKSMYGDALEAFVGAIYLDRGFKTARKFVIRKLIMPHFNLSELVTTTVNFKSKVIEWAQKSNVMIEFEVETISESSKRHEFKASVLLDGKSISVGIANSKKRAEQTAARKACEQLDLS